MSLTVLIHINSDKVGLVLGRGTCTTTSVYEEKLLQDYHGIP